MSKQESVSAPAYTPGPWTYMPGLRSTMDLSPGVRGADGFYVATIANDCPPSLTEANARLIAQAPAMAEALSDVFTELDQRSQASGQYTHILKRLRPLVAEVK